MKWLLQHGYYEKALAAVEEGNAKAELLEEVYNVLQCLMMLGADQFVNDEFLCFKLCECSSAVVLIFCITLFMHE